MNYPGPTKSGISGILTPSLIGYANDITFPWPLDSKLDGSDVGDVFFRTDSAPLWTTPPVKDALISLSKIGLSNIHSKDIISVLGSPKQPTFLHNAVGVILILDQGPRNLFKGIHARYIYDYFGILARNLTSYLVSLPPFHNPFNLQTWLNAGIELSHALLRISMLMAPLCHSDDRKDHMLHLKLTENVRSFYEEATRTKDPYRGSFSKDLKDIYLFANILNQGPPQGTVSIEQFVYWIMRYFTSHVVYVDWFARSPFRNCAVGRDDKEGEKEWLRYCGVKNDEMVREKVKEDMGRGVWTPLEIE
ncbi:uncharacterized protein LY89DRAFT_288940 [Mollisia scopiformis]|uniref:Uncharacterized protein n=1 Tax=Mollisia scopiformis TaxID=149040 RepID=A0A132BB42_MOLSC|nr:uncharacterized protein LY89DRAFT_288940 [Mollisia scopiformis]KUJ09493.1 hypothetical protein LY89DRAFT_288940 [Mollisia scopiformis]